MCLGKSMTRRPASTWGKGSHVHSTHSFAWLGSGGMGARLLLPCPLEQIGPCSLFWMA